MTIDDWQPIETAPLDGSRVLLWATRGNMLVAEPEQIVGAYRRGWWAGQYSLSHVTHWMPLPYSPDHWQRVAAVEIIARDISKMKPTIFINGVKQP